MNRDVQRYEDKHMGSGWEHRREPWRAKRVIGDAVLYLGDCRDVLPHVGKVDAVVTDPPYGVGLKRKTNDFRDSKHFDNGASLQASEVYEDGPEAVRVLIADAMPLVRAVATRAAITSGCRMMFDYPKPTTVGAIYVPNGAGGDPWGFGCFTPILYYGKCPYLAKGRGSRPNSFEDNQPNREKIDHPCPKPVRWMEWLVNRASLEGETVCDPFMGSGTTGVACARLGRRFIGIEIHDPYFEIACRRIEEAQRQGRLFAAPRPKPEQTSLLP